MAYRNQNYMTNKKIKAAVDKNQKGYQEEPQDEELKLGNLSITVKNSLDETIENANITLTDREDNTYTAKTGSAGGCNIKNLPLGEYLALAEADTYVSITQGVTIREGNNNLELVFTEQSFSIGGENGTGFVEGPTIPDDF